MPAFDSFLAIGDSFTEGMGDHYADGRERGWADLVAYALARERGGMRYANLAIRGRKLAGILAEQLEPALVQSPRLVSLNGGGNDMLRPTMALEDAARALRDAALRIRDAGPHVLLLSGADPTAHLPMGRLAHDRGIALGERVAEWAAEEEGVILCDNFSDASLRAPEYWAPDGLHLNTRGHARVAIRVLGALDGSVPPELRALADTALPITDYRSLAYYRAHVLPWIGRRLRRRSSGDGRSPKRALLAELVWDPARPFES